MSDESTDWSKWLKIGAAVLVVAALVVSPRFLPVGEWVEQLTMFVEGAGPWGYIVFGLAYVAATVLFIPGSLLTLVAGFVFGLFWGVVLISLSSTLGAGLAFLIGRFVARERIEPLVSERPRFDAVFRAIDKEGFKVVLLVRLSPLFPFNLLNYAFGLTRVSFWHYFFASWIGMFPGTVMYVYLGTAAKNLTQILAGDLPMSTPQMVAFGVGLVATIVVTVFVTRKAKEELRAMGVDVEESGEPEESDGT